MPKTRKLWTQTEVSFISTNYSKMSAAAMAVELCRSELSVKNKLEELKLYKNGKSSSTVKKRNALLALQERRCKLRKACCGVDG